MPKYPSAHSVTKAIFHGWGKRQASRSPRPEVYMNARGETVMTLAVFREMSFKGVCEHLRLDD